MSVLWLVLTLLPILGGAERFNCRGRILGAYYADAKSGCKAFHVCVRVAGGGVRDFRFFCPPGTLFHQEAQTCTDWGDDDPLACPADIYDGFDTKKVSSPGNREDEPEFGLQGAETGDRRLAQNNGASDLRTAHSSDFFSGQRDRGRDESAPPAPSSFPPSRQSFRRASTPRTTYPSSQYTTPSPSSPQYSSTPQYDVPKRKVLRKRPHHISTPVPTTTTTVAQPSFPPSTYAPQDYFIRRNPSQNSKAPTTTVNIPPQYKDEYVEVSRVTPKQNKYFSNNPSTTPYTFLTQTTPEIKNEGLVELYNYNGVNPDKKTNQDSRPFKLRNSFNVQSDVSKQTDFSRTKSFNQNYNRGTPGYSTNYPTTTVDYNSARGIITSTPAYRNFNSVSYEPEKNNFVSFPAAKQNYYNNPTTTSSPTTSYTTSRPDSFSNLNTIAYNTNNALNTQSSNYANSQEDDGQYRPPQGEDDGQYRPELYERESELLSGAHSLNIAASGNRLPDDQKPEKVRSQKQFGKVSTPRPFRPAVSVTTVANQQPVEIYTSTARPYSEQTTHRTFDYYQTYTTTSRPYEAPSGPASNAVSVNNAAPRATSTFAPNKSEAYSKSYENVQQNLPSSSPRPKHVPHIPNRPNKDDSSYDYAYYDSDPDRFAEYDLLEEFGRTNSRG
ncbi:mucin-5AC-like isoform X2 [Zerene cesonia]|uniref:mucin-5AC-like isoform X2 n=1 Tax=Zerene cesonia TaxID=33412 RepID=UPI0018E552B1|nr:mucin-5AC-like isoform X2 [Zerene cesonia]